jgi:hypothetical protein
MFNWLKKPAVTEKVRIIDREPWEITIEEWRANPHLCGQAETVLKSPLVIQMLRTLQNSHPSFNVLTNTNPNDRVVQQCRGEGYTMALQDFQLLAKHIKPDAVLTPTFENEDIDPKELDEFKRQNK